MMDNLPNYAVLFDLATHVFNHPLDKLITALVVAVFLAIVVVWPGLSFAVKAPGGLLAIGIAIVSVGEYMHFTSRYPALMEDVRNQQFSEIEGMVSRTRRDGTFVYRMGDRIIDVSSRRYPAFEADDEWMVEHLVGKCARVRMNRDGDILWLAVRVRGCATGIAPF
jgi:hypothetical protein